MPAPAEARPAGPPRTTAAGIAHCALGRLWYRYCRATKRGLAACLARRLGYTGGTERHDSRTTMLTTLDPEFEQHRETWLGFCRFMKIMVVVVVAILAGMAIFLL
jgi:hypothetical protein